MPITPERIHDIARSFQPSRVLLSAIELGVFAELSDHPARSSDVAVRIGADERGLDRLMNALVALGLLVKTDDLFANAEGVRDLLAPGGPQYMGGALMHTAHMWESWSTLTAAVRAGGSVMKRKGEERAKWVAPFIDAMHYYSSGRASEVVSALDLAGVRRVLDVGGGSGAYAIAFCKAKPEVEAVVFDLPDVVGITQRYVAQAGLSDRISTTTGDYNADEVGRGFDLVLLSAIIHSNSPAQNVELFARCRRALVDGGRIVVQDFIMEPDRTSPASAAFFALNMLVGTDSGDTFTEQEVRDWFHQTGFSFEKRIDPPEAGASLLIARAV